MMMQQDFELAKKMLRSRVVSLVQDNYFVMVDYISPDLSYIKLRHRSNGNIVEISANICSDYMQQKTNGKVTYCGKVQP